jgi:hypothetical protein
MRIPAVLLGVLVLVSCGASGIEPLKKATLDGSTTIETLANGMAGPRWFCIMAQTGRTARK